MIRSWWWIAPGSALNEYSTGVRKYHGRKITPTKCATSRKYTFAVAKSSEKPQASRMKSAKTGITSHTVLIAEGVNQRPAGMTSANITQAASACERTAETTTISRGNQIFLTSAALSTIEVVPLITADWKNAKTASPQSTKRG